jgi:uncharacterized protein YecE (DUF72 family)
MITDLRLGCMGFSYKEWVGKFYAEGTPPGRMLAQYATSFSTVELDTTFYAPPRDSAVAKWREETPDDFSFAAKVWQRVTHEQRFVDAQDDLAIFLRAVEPLGDKLGPLLLQCPPDLTIEALPAFEAFIEALPEGFRWAAEFRHRSWLVPKVRELLAGHNVALAATDLYYMPRFLVPTADFLYVRLLGNRKEITEIGDVVRDRSADVDKWAAQISDAMTEARAGWAYVNNHYSGFSPHTVGQLYASLGRPMPHFPADAPTEQPRLL